jgi:hypothetical protein
MVLGAEGHQGRGLILFPLLLGSVDVIEGSIEPNKPQSQDIYGVRQRGPAYSTSYTFTGFFLYHVVTCNKYYNTTLIYPTLHILWG